MTSNNDSEQQQQQHVIGSRKRTVKFIESETDNEGQQTSGVGRIERSVSRSNESNSNSGSERGNITAITKTVTDIESSSSITNNTAIDRVKENTDIALDTDATKTYRNSHAYDNGTNRTNMNESSIDLDSKIIQVEKIIKNLSDEETNNRLVLLRSILAELHERKAALNDSQLAARLNERRNLSSGTLLSDISLAPFMAQQPLSNSFSVGADNLFKQRQTKSTATQMPPSESVPLSQMPPQQQPPNPEFASSLGATLRLLSIPPLGYDLQKFLRYSALVVVTLLLLAILTPRLFFICVTLMLLVFLVFLLSVLHGQIKSFKQKATTFIRDRIFGKANKNDNNVPQNQNNYHSNSDAGNFKFPESAFSALLGHEVIVTPRKRKTNDIYSEMRDHIDAAKRALNDKNFSKSVDHITIAEAIIDGVIKDAAPVSSQSPIIDHQYHDNTSYLPSQKPEYSSGTINAPENDMPINLERLQQLRRRFNLN